MVNALGFLWLQVRWERATLQWDLWEYPAYIRLKVPQRLIQ